jgi:hypothetical protein
MRPLLFRVMNCFSPGHAEECGGGSVGAQDSIVTPGPDRGKHAAEMG